MKADSFLKCAAVVALGVVTLFAPGAARAETCFCEYIEASGGAAVDTGYVASNNTVIAFKGLYVSRNGQTYAALFKDFTDDSSVATRVILQNTSEKSIYVSCYTRGNGSLAINNVVTGLGNVITGLLNRATGTYTVNGQTVSYSQVTGTLRNKTVKLHDSGTAVTRLYYFTVVTNDVVVHDFRPYVKDDEAGYLDLVTGEFHGKVSGGTLTAGGEKWNAGRLTVTGVPVEGGTVTPAYGTNDGYSAGESVACSASSVWTNDVDGIAGACAGYKVYTNGVVMTSGSENSFSYTHPDCEKGATLEWQWDLSYKVTAADGVSVSSPWAAAGSTVTLTATVPATKCVYRWVDSVSGKVYKGNPLTVKVTAPMNLTPEFGTVYHVDSAGSDDATGLSKDAAFATIGKALAECDDKDAIKVWASAVPYEITASVVISKAVTIFGSSGDPADVVIRRNDSVKGFPNIKLDNANAVLRDVTVANGYQSNSWAGSGGVDFTANGGSLIHCIVTGCKTGAWGTGGGIFIAAKSSALVDRCVITNCSNSVSSDGCGGSAVHMASGTVRNSLMVGNSTSGSGAAGGTVRMSGGVLENCTLAGNKGAMCTGVYVSDASAKVRNCIIANNTSTGTTVPSEINWSGKSASFTNCLSDATINAGCLVETDIFESLVTGNYRPKVGSQALDAASGEAWMDELDAEDLDGNVRVSGTAADVGAYERDSASAAVSVLASGTEGIAPFNVTFTVKTQNITGNLSYKFDWKGDGTDVSTETSPTVVKTFEPGQYQVKVSVVAAGTTYAAPAYIPIKVVAKNIVVNPGDSIAAAVASAVSGCEIVLKTGTHPITASTTVEKGVTIRGETGNPEDVILSSDGKSHRIFYLNHPDATIAGIAMEKAYYKVYADGGATIRIGLNGGTVSNCVIRSGKVEDWNYGAGGIYISEKANAALVTHCVISNCIESGSGNGSFLGGGAAIVQYAGNVRNCLMTKNVRTSIPGDAACHYGTVRVHGGTFANCTIADNTGGKCAGVWATAGTVVNCLIAGNVTKSTTPSYAVYAGTASCFTNCVTDYEINDWCEVVPAPYVDFAKNDYHPAPGTYSINHATPFDWMTGTTDLEGNARIRGAKPDIGCYEVDPDAFSATFAMSATSGRGEAEVTFTVTPVNGAGQGYTCEWDWDGDGTFDTTVETLQTTHKFTDYGTHSILVRVTDKTSSSKVFTTPSQTFTLYPKTLYVSKTGSAESPYATKGTAAHDIQAALDAAADGCEIVIVPDTYTITAQTTVEKGVTIRGETGNPEDVILSSDGKNHRIFCLNDPGCMIAGVAMEKAYLDNHGDTGLGHGATVAIDVKGGAVSNCVIRGGRLYNWNHGGAGISIAGKADSALVTHCVISNCVENGANNGAYLGGGAAIVQRAGNVRNCLFTQNVRTTLPGDASCLYGTVRVDGGTMANCTVAGNTGGKCAGVWAKGGTVVNCLIAGNVTKSTTPEYAVYAGTASCFTNCVTDYEINGWCEVVTAPYADPDTCDYHPAPGTYSINHATPFDWMTGTTDLEGNARIRGTDPDIGCYEVDPNAFSATFAMSATKGFKPASVEFTVTPVNPSGASVKCEWDWNGDGSYDETTYDTTAYHDFTSYGAFNVGLRVTDNGGEGTAYTVPSQTFTVYPKTLYVAKDGKPTPPYAEEGSAAANLESALEAATDGSEIVLLPGVYTNTAAITVEKGVTIRGKTGNPEDVVLHSDGAYHRLFVLNSAQVKLASLVLENAKLNEQDSSGGAAVYFGIAGGMVSNCVVRGCRTESNYNAGGAGISIPSGVQNALVTHCVISNCAETGVNGDVGYLGGGAAIRMYAGEVRNCLMTKNVRTTDGGDSSCQYGTVRVHGGTLANCTIAGNAAVRCAGVWATAGKVVNCVIAGNTSSGTTASYPVWVGEASVFDTCVADLPITGGVNCKVVTQPFRDAENGNYHLAVGTDAVDGAKTDGLDWLLDEGATDLDATARVKGEEPDIGCYELEPVFAVGCVASPTKGIAPLAVDLAVTVDNAGDAGYDLFVNWGDGAGETQVTQTHLSHTYTTPGAYSVVARAYSRSLGRSESSSSIKIIAVPAVIWVRPDGDGAAYPYATRETAATNIAEAIELADAGCEVRLVAGTYPLKTQVDVGKAIRLAGETGRPEDVVLLHDRTVSGRVVELKNSGATLASVTVSDGWMSNGDGSGVSIATEGGTVSNCVIRNCYSAKAGNRGGGVRIDTPKNADVTSLVTHCVITNCSVNTWANAARAEAGCGSAVAAYGGIVRNSLVAYNYLSEGEVNPIGGTVYLSGSAALQNCTVVSNRAAYLSGVYVEGTSAEVRNTIISANVTVHGGANDRVYCGNANRFMRGVSDVTINAGCPVEAPEATFRRPARGDWRLRKGTVAFDYGTYAVWMDGATDLGGNPRLLGKRPDVGCYERFDGGFLLIVR